jgi:outer membrane protein assembly factor BamE (lipoprotein component of BamABCDE complex)
MHKRVAAVALIATLTSCVFAGESKAPASEEVQKLRAEIEVLRKRIHEDRARLEKMTIAQLAEELQNPRLETISNWTVIDKLVSKLQPGTAREEARRLTGTPTLSDGDNDWYFDRQALGLGGGGVACVTRYENERLLRAETLSSAQSEEVRKIAAQEDAKFAAMTIEELSSALKKSRPFVDRMSFLRKMLPKLRPGMDRAEVLKLIGDPQTQNENDDIYRSRITTMPGGCEMRVVSYEKGKLAHVYAVRDFSVYRERGRQPPPENKEEIQLSKPPEEIKK